MDVVERVADLDADAACAAVVEAHARMVTAEAERFALAAHWADLHSGEALDDERRRRGTRRLPGSERSRRIGADGTPPVAEFAAMELGALQGMGHVAAACLMRDALNVRHRHPLLWRAVMEGEARVWLARKVAQMCASAGLSEGQARWVDARTTGYAASLPWTRFETLVEAKIVEADPLAAEQRRRTAALARFVRTGQSSEYGLKTLVARAAAGDVIFFVAMVDRIAEILRERGDADPLDVRRSKAIGVLASPARALRLLLEAARPDDQVDDPAEGAGVTAEEPTPGHCPGCGGDPTPFLKRVDPERLLPRATLYVHISAETLSGRAGVARVEGVGPATRQQVVELLGHTRVRVVPVVDLADQSPVDGYETPTGLAEALHLLAPACASPWSSNLSRRKDRDHVRPYVSPRDGGPPGQTALGNLAPLHRFPHRVKTHGRWRLRQRAPGIYDWTSPHGYRFRVDHTGTHPLGKERGAIRHSTSPLEADFSALIARAG